MSLRRRPAVLWKIVLVGWLLATAACSPPTRIPPTLPPFVAVGNSVTFAAWPDVIPPDLFDAFARETGVRVTLVPYRSAQEAIQIAAEGRADVLLSPAEATPTLIAAGQLAPIQLGNLPNFRNLSANFRDLAYDPGNRHSIPLRWGTVGLLVRTDLIVEPVTRWADLWDARYAGRLALWTDVATLLPIALKALGYSANSADPVQQQAALQHLVTLRDNALWWSSDRPSIAPALVSGQAAIAYGWPYDAWLARQQGAPVQFVLPTEGALLWGDDLVLPAAGGNRPAAEQWINYLLQPEIAARLVDAGSGSPTNEAARPLVSTAWRDDPAVFPAPDALRQAEWYLPFDPAACPLVAATWGDCVWRSARR